MIITVADRLHYQGSKSLTSVAKSNCNTPESFQIEKVHQAVSSSQPASGNEYPMVIPLSASGSTIVPNLRAILQEPPLIPNQVLSLTSHLDPEHETDENAVTSRRLMI